MSSDKQLRYEPNRDHEGLQVLSPTNQHSISPHENYPPRPSEKHRILGLTVAVFWTVIVLLVVITVGGIATGVGVGLSSSKAKSVAVASQTSSSISPDSTSASRASQTSNASSQTSTTATTTTSSSTTSSATGGPSPIISTPCSDNPSSNGTVLTAHDSTGASVGTFQLLCNTNYPAGSVYGNPNIVDLLRLSVSDMNACINACAMWNLGYDATNGGKQCEGVAVVKAQGDACYLKSATGVNNTSTSNGSPIDSAMLITS